MKCAFCGAEATTMVKGESRCDDCARAYGNALWVAVAIFAAFLLAVAVFKSDAHGATLRACFVPSAGADTYRTKQCVGTIADCPVDVSTLWVPVDGDTAAVEACATPEPQCDCKTIFDVMDPPPGVTIPLSFHLTALAAGAESEPSNAEEILLTSGGPIPPPTTLPSPTTTSSTSTSTTLPSVPTTTLPAGTFIGTKTVGIAGTMGADRKRVSCYSLPASAPLGKCYAYLAGGSAPSNYDARFVIYRRPANEPTALHTVSEAVTVTAGSAGAWRTFTMPAQTLPAQTYCIGYHTGAPTGGWFYQVQGGTADFWITTDPYADGPSDPWGALNEHWAATISAYCELGTTSPPTTSTTSSSSSSTASTSSTSTTSTSSSSSSSSSSTSSTSTTSTSSTSTTATLPPPQIIKVWIRQSDGTWITQAPAGAPLPGTPLVPVFQGVVP